MLSPTLARTALREEAAATLVLALGGQRSGKSLWAERRTRASGLELVYIATARAGDSEMAARIALHRQRRGADWTLVEAPVDLPGALAKATATTRAVLVDCLTLWLSNLLCDGHDPEPSLHALTQALAERHGLVTLVSNEVGQGVIPMGELSRRFVDLSGTCHQRIATLADEVVLVTAGLPHALKGPLAEV